ncbi:Alpha/Beta hydrolase protein [Clohesyomyces aquaticus]|uniref:Alpha/Beta hydrolase protein n=1 Tax=Clohesyomyces aquaticus TaxID=1231657 RepID=A0A1Y1ZKL8_9PLEO|nr:Alpha/Beta hydrolase protein [Clohesyomyces aquaticus]
MDSASWKAYGKIDPELEALIPHLPPSKGIGDYDDVPSLREGIMEGFKKLIEAGIVKLPDLSSVKKDIHIPARDGHQIRLAHYRKDGAEDGPIIVLFHGGGFAFGWPESFEEHVVGMLELGAVVVAVQYRLASENPFPAAPNDAIDSVHWIAENAAQLGADPTKGFIVGGSSAGANLAAVVSHEAVDSKLSPPLTGVWLNIPLLVHRDAVPDKYKQHYNSYEDMKDAMILDRKALDFIYKEYNADPSSPLMSPLIWPTGHKGQPATYFQICGQDPLRDEGLIYEHILREECGVPTKVQLYPGIPHGGLSFLPMLSHAKQSPADIKEGITWLLDQK